MYNRNENEEANLLLIEKSPAGVAVASGKRLMPKLPMTYSDLQAKFTVQVRADKKIANRAVGCFPLHKVPDGKYRIYYFRPKNRNRMLGRGNISISGQSNSCSG